MWVRGAGSHRINTVSDVKGCLHCCFQSDGTEQGEYHSNLSPVLLLVLISKLKFKEKL